ncbi:tyrosine-protein kinase SYK-like isoform X1 [Bolinopsis microptera]|uniref:tyrosine-protein kinase SYK-like isoform X1 n=1 Tax=Bolinopsis microptera TaxID=2820187 RepID=UPI00307A58A9
MEVDLYFHGNVDRETAECRLMLYSSSDGTYLIRSKDEENYVISVYFRRQIAHYLINKQDDGTIVWDSNHVYESLENMIYQHSIEPEGMVTLLTDGCPVRYFIVQDSLFPGHQCAGLCWFHGRLAKEQISLRLAITDPVTGSFLVTNSQSTEAIYILNIWNNNKLVQYSVLEKDNELCITLNRRFRNLLSLIEHYLTDDSLGTKLIQPCCVTVWHQRGHLSHPPQILPPHFCSSDVEASLSDGSIGETRNVVQRTPQRTQRKVAIRGARRKAANLNVVLNLSNLSLSDNDSPHCGETDMALGFYNMTYSSDEEKKPKKSNKDDTGITLELHNTLSRKGSHRIKRKSMEKSQRKLQKIRATQPQVQSSSSDELVLDGPSSRDQAQTKLKRRNAKEKRKNKKHFLKQSEVDDLKSSSARLSLDLNSILCSELLGGGVSSKVYKGTLHHAPVAIKKVNRGSSKWQHEPAAIEHDNILRLIGYGKDHMVVTELCEIGSLDTYLLENDRKVTSPLNVLSWLRDISNALLHLEQLNIPLRALSCRNILLNSAHCAKLSLFSTTRLLNDQGKKKEACICIYPTQETHKIRWYPTDNKTCLTWSFGITLLEAIHYAHFKYKHLLDIKYNNGMPIITFQPHVPIAVRNLIKSCIRQRPSDRPSLKVVVTS